MSVLLPPTNLPSERIRNISGYGLKSSIVIQCSNPRPPAPYTGQTRNDEGVPTQAIAPPLVEPLLAGCIEGQVVSVVGSHTGKRTPVIMDCTSV
jgi:hypothetical protein